MSSSRAPHSSTASIAASSIDSSVPTRPLDVLSQQIVAEIAAREISEDEMFALIRRAWPYRTLERKDFDAVVTMLADGFTTRRGRRGALIHHDGVNHMLRPRRGARLTAITSGGAIPDNADYQVLLDPENIFIGTVNEDFAVESMAGDIFQLGNHSYRIIRVEKSAVRVEDAHGQPPTTPVLARRSAGAQQRAVLFGLALPRADGGELQEGSERRKRAARAVWPHGSLRCRRARGRGLSCAPATPRSARCRPRTPSSSSASSMKRAACSSSSIRLSAAASTAPGASRYASASAASSTSSFRRRRPKTTSCLSLTTAHSFDLADVARYLHPATVKPLLIQALLDAPMFTTRWRWVAGTSLALPRFRGGKKVPAPLARMNAEDLLATVFPDQVACGENLVGEREVPDHPLVNQTIDDCLNEGMDFERLRNPADASALGRHSRRLLRSDRAFAARARSALRASLRLSSTMRRSKSAARKP